MFRFETALTVALALLISTSAAGAEDSRPRDQRILDERARSVETSLKDLSARNDDGIDSIQASPRPAERAFDGDRAGLISEELPSAEVLVREDVDSSLHRLRREAVSRQTRDSRKARIDGTQDHRKATPSGQ